MFQFIRYVTTHADLSGENMAVKSSASLPHFSKVEPYLFRGGAPTQSGLAELKAMGVKTIIDFRLSPDKLLWERMQCANLGMNYISLPTKFLPTQEAESTMMRVLTEASKDPAKAPVFIHCAHGSDRTSYAVALWRVKHDNWSLPDAVSEMIANGFLIHRLK
jgi:protein tyrosine/serine phosphatase